ncbi:MAG: gamma-glutamyltransferase [Bryobacteraceae bacterium]
MRFLWVGLTAVVLFGQNRPPQKPAPTTRPVVRGRQWAVSTMKPEGTQVAASILMRGGNAFDAAVAAQAVLGLVDANNNGIGGDATLLVFDAASGKAYSLNAEGTAPKLATIEWYKTHHKGTLPDSDGLLSGTAPGVVDAWYTMLDRWGTLTFGEVLQPAIAMARDGFPLNDRLARAINGSKKLRKYPSSVRVYAPGGKVWKPGEIFRNPDLARTLERLVEAERAHAGEGRRAALRAARDRFYKGDIAREMAAFSEANGGLFRYEDFASYTALVETPVSSEYRGWTIVKNPSASQGPAELFTLNLLAGFDLKAMGHNSARYIHTSVEAVKLAFADREFIGDETVSKAPYERLLSAGYTDARRKLIDPARASLEFRQGDAGPAHPRDVVFEGEDRETGDTSYAAVVDAKRNMVSFTPSLHNSFGTNVVMEGLGFSFNCRGDYYSLVPGHPNALAPGKRPRSTLQGTLVLKDGRPAMVMGSPGGDDQIMRTMQTFLNIVEFGMNVQQAIEAPRWSTRSFPQSPWPHKMYRGEVTLESRIPGKVKRELDGMGHKVKMGGAWSLGMNAAIVVDDAGTLNAGADPRVDAYALAW